MTLEFRAFSDWLKILPTYNLIADSRQVNHESVFFAIRGTTGDGHNFLSKVVEAKPLGVVVEDASKVPANFSGAVWAFPNSRSALDFAAAQRFDFPAQKLKMYGVTGTNGKTTTTHLIEHLSNESGQLCGVLGTIDHHVGSTKWETNLTTPDPVTLQQRLQEMLSCSATSVAMEVSSHALAQHRTDAVEFEVAIFTNLTRDHLDYHGSMEEYFDAKQRLFIDGLLTSRKPRLRAVVNVDDPWGQKLINNIKLNPNFTSLVSVVGFGSSSTADYRISNIQLKPSGTTFLLSGPQGERLEIHSPMVGEFNVYNVVAAALAVADELDLNSVGAILANLKSFIGVSGRMERVVTDPFAVFVDYAHTDDALRSALRTLREVMPSTSGAKLRIVFGCGGDRDKGKRPLMMAAALDGADVVYLTSDNPRHEDPMAIINDALVAAPATERSRISVNPDRKASIAKAIADCKANDILLIAGKGHEQTQQIGDVKTAFSDQEVAREIISLARVKNR